MTLLSTSSVFPRPPAVPLVSIAGLVGLGAFQILPLPERVLKLIAPVNLAIYHETTKIVTLFGHPALAPRISVAPEETATVCLLLIAYAALFFSATVLLSNRIRRRLLAAALLTSAAAQILVGAVEHRDDVRVRGFFPNPDHFAGYLEIALAVAFGILWAEALTNRERVGSAVERSERFERRFPALAACLLLWSLFAVGIILTQSRGGILAAGATSIVMLGIVAFHRSSRRRGRAALGTALALLVGVFLIASAGASHFARLLSATPRELSRESRVLVWRSAGQAFRQFPVVGSGLGTFREAFRRVQPRELRGTVEQAHNDVLQMAITGGVVGGTIGLALFVSLFLCFLRTWKSQRHREESAFVLAGFGALLSLALHGLVEFNLSISVIPATLATLLGGSWAAGRRG